MCGNLKSLQKYTIITLVGLLGISTLGMSLPSQKIAEDVTFINIEVPVRVFKGNNFIDNLTMDDFEVYEDVILQNIMRCPNPLTTHKERAWISRASGSGRLLF